MKCSPQYISCPSDTIFSYDNIIDFLFHFTKLTLCLGPEMFFTEIFYTRSFRHPVFSTPTAHPRTGVLGGEAWCHTALRSHSLEGGRTGGGGVTLGPLDSRSCAHNSCSEISTKQISKLNKLFHGSGISVHGPLLFPVSFPTLAAGEV